VTVPAAVVRLFGTGAPVEAQADQYGAWAKYVSVGPGQEDVYGYAESKPDAGKPPLRKYFRMNVFTMEQATITEKEFNARPTR
jgi:hypothetical protein